MKRRTRNLLTDRRGVAALEFALVSIPLMMLAFGTIEFGRLIWTRQALQATAAEVARCIGVLSSSCASGGAYSSTNAATYAEGVASGWGVTLTNADLTMTASSASGACSGLGKTLAEVTISYTYNTAVPGLLPMLAGGSALTGHACFPIQS
jgi:Flp pilus assembly protein TadG